jgi:hypothetical protein
MKALVIGNCATVTYSDTLKAIFTDWEVRRVAEGAAQEWLIGGSKPEFTQFLQSCDLIVSHPHLLEFQPLANSLNPKADRIIIPGLVFSGLHPDIAILPRFNGVFSSSQTSLIAVGACARGLGVYESLKLYNETTYAQLGYFDHYEKQKHSVISNFRKYDIDLVHDFPIWESQGDFFYFPIHARVFVLADILRRALLGRYINGRVHSATANLSLTLPDHLGGQTWPIYPELAARRGFAGSLIWRGLQGYAEMSLVDFVSSTFQSLSTMEESWRHVSFVEQAGATLRP